MSQPEWGAKHTCLECAQKFYDFGKDKAACPNCGAAAPAPKSRGATPGSKRISRNRFGRDPLHYRTTISSEDPTKR